MGAGCFRPSLDKTIRTWQAGDGAAFGGVNTQAPVNAIAIVNEGAQIAAGGADNLIRVWDIAAATVQPPAETAPASTLAGHEQPIMSLASVPGMPARIFSGSADGSARLWNLADGKVLHKLDHGSAVTAVAVRPDGARFATAGVNGIAKLWNAADGKMLAEMRGDVATQLRMASVERTIAGRQRDVTYLTAAVGTAEKAATSEAEGVKKSMEAVTAAEKAVGEKTEAVKKAEEEKVAAEKASTEATAAAKAAEEAKAGADQVIADAEGHGQIDHRNGCPSEGRGRRPAPAEQVPGRRQGGRRKSHSRSSRKDREHEGSQNRVRKSRRRIAGKNQGRCRRPDRQDQGSHRCRSGA